MEALTQIELFSRTFDNRFVFSLFDLLLCGIIVLVIVRGSSRRADVAETRNRLFLLLAVACLGGAFACSAVFAGSYFFFRKLLAEAAFDLLVHALRASAWLWLIASACHRPPRAARAPRWPWLPEARLVGLWLLAILLLLTTLWTGAVEPFAGLAGRINGLLDLLNIILLAIVLLLFHRRPLGKHNTAMIALAILLVAALLHPGYFAGAEGRVAVIAWNLEQFTWSLALFTFALAIGETSGDLFYRVFVGLQVAFILLASVMILVITQTEKTEYLAGLRSRSDELAEFVRANVDYLSQQGESLPAVVGREDFLQRAIWGFGHLPELRVVRVAAGRQVATFEINDDGEIQQNLETLAASTLPQLNPDEYFLMHALPLGEPQPGSVEFYGTREYLDRHIRKRIVIIFTLFTGIVGLSTLLIGQVVRGTSATLRQQAREIEQAQQQLLQASKLAAIGQLAAGVAHEINNPATTILSRASFLLSGNGNHLTASDAEDLEAIVTQAQRIAHITNDLLQFSRPQINSLKPVPIERVIDRSLRLLGQSANLGHISIERRLEPHLPRLLANEERLIRALENLFRNAVDAMPEGGTLRITVTRDPQAERLRLEITDSGCGILRENLAHVFEPFFTTKEVGKGTGLGLAIVHGIIKEHRGIITVESESGKGTRFVITLPTEE